MTETGPAVLDSQCSRIGILSKEGITMTPDTKKTVYWTGGTLAAIVVIIAALWMAGIFAPPPVQ